MMNIIGQFIHRARPWIYKIGLHPKQGSIWFSPSLNLKYGMAKAIKATAKSLKRK